MLTLASGYTDLLDREWARLAGPGTWLDSERRIAVATVARDARRGMPSKVPLQPMLVEVARRISADPTSIDAEWVQMIEAEGLDLLTYVEVLGVCARLAAIDTFLFGVGHHERPLPEPVAGEPSRRHVAAAEIDGGFAPTVGRAFPPNALSAVQAEHDGLHDLHGGLYLRVDEMGELGIERDITRPQMELTAARTSLLNECFF